MMQNNTHSVSPLSPLLAAPLEDFGHLQERYQSLGLARRAATVLLDAEPALQTADRLLTSLAAHSKITPAFDRVRKNHVLTGKMRASEAKNLLVDDNDDFIEATRRKLAAWRKTMERLAQGEDIVSGQDKEYIPSTAPLALAIAGIASISSYLSIVQLALAELVKIDARNAKRYTSSMAEIRRCATLLSDCEHASGIHTLVH